MRQREQPKRMMRLAKAGNSGSDNNNSNNNSNNVANDSAASDSANNSADGNNTTVTGTVTDTTKSDTNKTETAKEKIVLPDKAVETNNKAEAGTAKTELKTSGQSLAEALLTEEELALVQSGTKINVEMDAKDTFRDRKSVV